MTASALARDAAEPAEPPAESPAASPAPASPAPAGTFQPSVVTAFCHDCRTPLAVIANSASIVREELEAEGAEGESIEFLEGITQRAIEIEGLLSDLRFLHAHLLEAPSLPDEPASYAGLMDDVAPQLERVVTSLGHRLRFDFDPELSSGAFDTAVLSHAITSAITELCRPPNTAATLSVKAATDDDGRWVRIGVRRSEATEDPDTRSRMPFEDMNDEPADEGGLRFRLQVAAALLRLFGGTLVASQGSAHRALTILLPVSAASGDEPAPVSRLENAIHRDDGRGDGQDKG